MRRAGKMEELQNLAAFLMADGCEFPHRPDHRRRRRRLPRQRRLVNELFAWSDATGKEPARRSGARTKKTKRSA